MDGPNFKIERIYFFDFGFGLMNVVPNNNTSKPEPVLEKKSNSSCNHFIREAVAMTECLTTHIPTLRNFAYLLTKVLYGKKRKYLVGGVLHFIYDHFGYLSMSATLWAGNVTDSVRL